MDKFLSACFQALKFLYFKLNGSLPKLKSSARKHKRYNILPTAECGHEPSEVDSEPMLIKNQSLRTDVFVSYFSPYSFFTL